MSDFLAQYTYRIGGIIGCVGMQVLKHTFCMK